MLLSQSTLQSWRWYWYLWGGDGIYIDVQVILFSIKIYFCGPYSNSSSLEVQSLRSGLHKWEFTHAQLTLILPFEWTHRWYKLNCLTHFHLPPSFLYQFVNTTWKQRWQLRPARVNFGCCVKCLPWPLCRVTHQAAKSTWTTWSDGSENTHQQGQSKLSYSN